MEIKKLKSLEEIKQLENAGLLQGFFDIDDDLYFDKDCPGITRSRLNDFSISPKNYKLKEILDEKKDTASLRFGSMFHLAMENWDFFNETYQSFPEFTGPRGGKLIGEKKQEAIEKWQLENNCLGIDSEEKNTIEIMRETILKNNVFQSLFNESEKEVTIFAKCPQTNLLLRSKIDLLKIDTINKNILLGDYKTCQSMTTSDDHELQSTIFGKYRLYIQQVFYQYLCNILGYECEFKFIFIEKDYPFGLRIVDLPIDIFDYGIQIIIDELTRLSYCSISNSWPDKETLLTIDIPQYFKNQFN